MREHTDHRSPCIPQLSMAAKCIIYSWREKDMYKIHTQTSRWLYPYIFYRVSKVFFWVLHSRGKFNIPYLGVTVLEEHWGFKKNVGMSIGDYVEYNCINIMHLSGNEFGCLEYQCPEQNIQCNSTSVNIFTWLIFMKYIFRFNKTHFRYISRLNRVS